MQLTEKTRELLIDYIFEKDEHENLDRKYAGLESIILKLVNEGKVRIANTSDGDIEDFLKLFSFVEVIDTSMFQLTKYAINIDKVISDTGFATYREKEIKSQLKEIKLLENEIVDSLNLIKELESVVMSD